ncbi:NAD(P)H-dependent oxidoreductase [Paenibacillus sp. NPDC056933]|uniref:NAD(P)H-dependent oxidoreductase n=1 Tax=Paenibacillus sp. NPDC056933 TaxID=3345968 RepID=UPI00363A133E
MTNVLVVKGNNRPDGISTKMFETFVSESSKFEGLNVKVFDVFEANMPYFGQDLYNAYGKAQTGEAMKLIESASLEAVRKCRDALDGADVVVYAFPLWNQTIPAAMLSFIDYTYAPGYSFRYNENGQLESLLTHKKYIVLNARGGYYSSPEANAGEMCVNFINKVVGQIFGMQKFDEIIIEGHNADSARSDEIISTGLGKVVETVHKLAKESA